MLRLMLSKCCPWDLNLWCGILWYRFWRLVAGVAGVAVGLINAAPQVQDCIQKQASGIVMPVTSAGHHNRPQASCRYDMNNAPCSSSLRSAEICTVSRGLHLMLMFPHAKYASALWQGW